MNEAPERTDRARSQSRPTALLGAVLGVVMGLSNVLGYLIVLLLSRTLGPADFGGYTALSTYGVLLAIPAGALQVVIARRVSGKDGAEAELTSGLRLALILGTGLWAVTALLSPVLTGSFHLRSLWSPVLLGAMLVPMLATGCFQGILLGRGRLQALSLLYFATGVSRLVAAVGAFALNLPVEGVFAVMLAAAVVTAAVGWLLCRGDVAGLPRTGHGLVAEMVRSNSTLAAYVALTNVDVLLARHFLSPHDSGGYALASTFGRAMCWGTQFIALIIVPRMASGRGTVTLFKASALVLAIGVAGFGIVAINPSGWVTLAGGPGFAGFGGLALACVGLGIAWALAQVWLFSEMGTNQGVLGALTWCVIAAQVIAIATLWHHSAAQIVAVCSVGAVTVALAGLIRVVRRHQGIDISQESAVLAADHT